MDLALLPVAGWGPELGSGGHLDPESAARAAALIRPRVAVPIHWGTLYPRGRRLGDWFTEPARRFAAHAAELAPDVEVRVLAPGESLTSGRENIPPRVELRSRRATAVRGPPLLEGADVLLRRAA